MRITHESGASFLHGHVSEERAIRDWIWRAQQLDSTIVIMADECDEYESCFTIVGLHLTQKERQEIFQQAK